MTLRRRLLLVVLLAAVPLVLGVAWLRAAIETRNRDESMREFALAYMEAGGRQRAERDPVRFFFDGISPPPPARPPPGPPRPPLPHEPPGDPGGPPPEPFRPPPGGPPPRGPLGPPPPGGPGTRLWAYGEDLLSQNPRAPAIPEDLAQAIADGASLAGADWTEGPHRGRRVAVRMPWSGGPAAVVLVERIVDSGSGSSGIFLTGALAVVVGLLLAVWLAAGPVVRRIRRLTEAVRRSSDSNYETGVETRGTDEVSRLARAFDEAATTIRSHLARIESRERTLREFVANTTHDVAIPLTVLQGHLARLQALAERADGSAQDAARAAVEEAHYIGSLLQNLAAAAKLESGEVHLDLHPVDLGALVERVAARHAPIAAASSVTLEHSVPEEPVLAAGDHTLLEQAVNNAVHNAIRHNRAGGHAAVILETPRSKAGRFLLRVVDDGPGIPDTERNHMLERGARGTAARTRAPDGLGLGLHIANTVAKRHGFALTLAESEFGGLELSIEGPLAPGDLATS